MKLVIFHELARNVPMRLISEFLELTSKDNDDLAELYRREMDQRDEEDDLIWRINKRQFDLVDLLTRNPVFCPEQWDAIWDEEHRGVSLRGPSTFSISKADIRLARLFLLDHIGQEKCGVSFRGMQHVSAVDALAAVVHRLEFYEGSRPSYLEFDLDALDDENRTDAGEVDEEMVELPPASFFTPHAAELPHPSHPAPLQS